MLNYLEQQLVEKLGAKVDISYNRKGKGKLVISYASLEELDGIISHINPDYTNLKRSSFRSEGRS